MAKKTPAATENTQDAAQALPESAIAPEAANTLPFAQKRDELLKKFRANAVPREADYQQLLNEHYNVAGALGMANSGDNNGATTGNGLMLENDKLHVKAKVAGGLKSDTSGISLVTGSSLEIGTDNKLGVRINQRNGLKLSTEGEVGVNLYANNLDSDTLMAAVIVNNPANASGLWINVGNAGYKKGLKQYQGADAYGAVLGVSHDDTLKIDGSSGKLGINTIKLPVTGASSPLTVSNGKVGVNLYENNTDTDNLMAAVIANNPANGAGLWINVGNSGDKKGLKQYKGSTTYGAVLGVSHDDTLRIDGSTGKLGVKLLPQGGLTSSSSGISVSIRTSSGLTTSGGHLAVQAGDGIKNTADGIGLTYSRESALRLYGSFLNAKYYDVNHNQVLYVYEDYFILLLAIDGVPPTLNDYNRNVYIDDLNGTFVFYEGSRSMLRGAFKVKDSYYRPTRYVMFYDEKNKSTRFNLKVV